MWTADPQATRSGRGRAPALRPARRWALAALAGFALAGCGRTAPPGDVQATGWLFSARLGPGPGAPAEQRQIRGGDAGAGWPWLPHVSIARRSPGARVHPMLTSQLALLPAGDPVEVLVHYDDPVAMPVFPGGDAALAGADSLALARCDSIADSLAGVRAGWYAAERQRLAAGYGATLVDSFWITRAVVARLRARDVPRLAARPDVRFVQPAHRGPPAPAYCDEQPAELAARHAVTGDGRKLINSDPLRDAGHGGGRLALLDTGVWPGHQLLAGAASSTAPLGPALVPLDCVDSWNCSGPDPKDTDTGTGGHGTIACGILVGDDSMGDCLQGMTRAHVTSHRVYRLVPTEENPSPTVGELDPAAYLHAIEKLLRRRPAVAVLEVADRQGPAGPLSSDAGRLFAAGVAVVAAAGNGYSADAPGESWIAAPGNHPWVIAAGARPAKDPKRTTDSQSRGFVGYRCKPDVQGPTETRSSGIGEGGDEHLATLSGTSGATPYVGGAALLLHGWMRAQMSGFTNRTLDPGQVYAALIACGSNRRTAPASQPVLFPVAEGAGMIRLPSSGRGWWGKLRMSSFASVTIPLGSLPPATRRLRAALWWPDPPPFEPPLFGLEFTQHCDFDLELLDPGGNVVAASEGVAGVFERVETRGLGAAAGMRVRVRANGVGLFSRVVYVAVMAE